MSTISSPTSARRSARASCTMPVRVPRAGALGVLVGGHPEEDHAGDAEGGQLADLLAERLAGVLHDAGQAGDRLRLGDALAHEQRRHQVVDRDAGLGDEAAQRRGAAQPAQPALGEGHGVRLPAGRVRSPGRPGPRRSVHGEVGDRVDDQVGLGEVVEAGDAARHRDRASSRPPWPRRRRGRSPPARRVATGRRRGRRRRGGTRRAPACRPRRRGRRRSPRRSGGRSPSRPRWRSSHSSDDDERDAERDARGHEAVDEHLDAGERAGASRGSTRSCVLRTSAEKVGRRRSRRCPSPSHQRSTRPARRRRRRGRRSSPTPRR